MTIDQQNICTPVTSANIVLNWICSVIYQLIILCMDASPSMEGRKAFEASVACNELVYELNRPEYENRVVVSTIEFWKHAVIRNKTVSAADLAQHLAPIKTNPQQTGTNIYAALDLAHKHCLEVIRAEKNDMRWLRPVVLLFSDGEHNTGPNPEQMADELRETADLVTIAFGDDADEATLRRLATTPQHFVRCSDGRQLRNYLAAVGKTLSSTIASGVNATSALSSLSHINGQCDIARKGTL